MSVLLNRLRWYADARAAHFPGTQGACEMTNNAKQPDTTAPQPDPLLQPLDEQQETVASDAKKQEVAPAAKKQEV
jgi:hypothetical protein